MVIFIVPIINEIINRPTSRAIDTTSRSQIPISTMHTDLYLPVQQRTYIRLYDLILVGITHSFFGWYRVI